MHMHGITFAVSKICSSLVEYAWDTVSHNSVKCDTPELTLYLQGHIKQILHFLSYNFGSFYSKIIIFCSHFFY